MNLRFEGAWKDGRVISVKEEGSLVVGKIVQETGSEDGNADASDAGG